MFLENTLTPNYPEDHGASEAFDTYLQLPAQTIHEKQTKHEGIALSERMAKSEQRERPAAKRIRLEQLDDPCLGQRLHTRVNTVSLFAGGVINDEHAPGLGQCPHVECVLVA
jgi:hypothetical protein